MTIDAVKIQPEHSSFLDSHFGVAPQWADFQNKLKDRTFADAVSADTRSNDKLKAFVQAIGMREQDKGRTAKVPSDSSGSYQVQYHSSANRFSCTCPDWTYKKSVGGGDCKHIDRMKTRTKNNLMKTASVISPADVMFRVGRVINREHKDRAATERLKTENAVYEEAYPRPGFVQQWLKHANDQELTKKMTQAVRRLLSP